MFTLGPLKKFFDLNADRMIVFHLLQKFLETASDAGQKLNTQLQDFAKDVGNKVTELTKEAEKKE